MENEQRNGLPISSSRLPSKKKWVEKKHAYIFKSDYEQNSPGHKAGFKRKLVLISYAILVSFIIL